MAVRPAGRRMRGAPGPGPDHGAGTRRPARRRGPHAAGGAPDPDPFRPEQGTAAFFVLVFLSAVPAARYVSWYGTYGGGGHYYIITETDLAECDLEPFRPPADCRTGTIRDRCASHGGTWDAAGRECSDISKRSCDLITYEPPIRNGATRCLDTSEPPCDFLEKSDYYNSTCFVPAASMSERARCEYDPGEWDEGGGGCSYTPGRSCSRFPNSAYYGHVCNMRHP